MSAKQSLCTILLLAISVPALAASSKRVDESIAAANLSYVDFEVSVAEMEIEVYDGDSVELDVFLEADRDWWFFGRNDIDDVEVEIDQNGERLYIRLDEDNIQQEWRVRLPAHLEVSMEVGVGEVELSNFANDLHLELGVGSVQLDVADVDFDTIHLEVGVGDVSIRGFDTSSDNERSFVGADSWYYGEGEFEISVDVGVGDADVRRR